MPAFSIFKNEGLYDVGSGPYKIKGKYQTNELKLVRNKYSSLLGGAKELNIYNLKTSKKALKLINQIDVVFAASEQARNNFDTSEEGNFQVSSSQSLGFFHLYLNTSSPKLKNATLRKKIRSYYLKLDRNKFASIPFADKLNTYFPKNILLPSYYSDSPNKEKEGSYSILKDQELDVILDNVYFTAGFGEKLKKHFAKVGLKLNIKLTNPHELWTIKEEGNYDIITLGYMGNFPDPDGFLDPIYSSGLFNYLNSKDELVKDQVNEVKHLANAQMRLKSYERIIKEFEGLGYFLPGFQVQTPIIHNKRLSIPKAVYRYEGQIFDIIWQNLKKDL